jgi:hypothetical protein
MKHILLLFAALVGAGLIVAALVLGAYLILSQAAQNRPANALINSPLSCAQVLAEVSEQAQGIDCGNMPDSSACYGHRNVDYETASSEPVVLDEPGDKELLRKLKTISTSPLNLETGDWGVALLRTRLVEKGQPANVPPITFMLYGATTIENNSQVTNALVDSMHPEGLHAFYFDTRGLGLTTECRELPVGGVAIESPEGYRVAFTANEVEISIGSTVVLQAVPYVDMRVIVLRGHATVTAVGETVAVGVGQEAIISMAGQNGLQANKPPYVQNTNPAALALSSVCQLTTWDGINMPCSMPTVVPATPTFTPFPPPTAATPTPTSSPIGPYITANVNANVRSGDDIVYEAVGALLAGQTAPVLGLSCTGSGWYYIPLNGRQGFVSNQIVTLTGSTVGLPCSYPPPRPTSPPPPDSDGDGFLDTADHCPFIYAPDSYDGCPLPTPTRTVTLVPTPVPTKPSMIPPDLVVYLAGDTPTIDCSGSPVTGLMRQDISKCVTYIDVIVGNVSHGSLMKPFTVEVTATGGGYWSTTVDELAGGDSVLYTATLQTSCYQPDCTIKVVADPGNMVPELNEANNVDSKTFLG